MFLSFLLRYRHHSHSCCYLSDLHRNTCISNLALSGLNPIAVPSFSSPSKHHRLPLVVPISGCGILIRTSPGSLSRYNTPSDHTHFLSKFTFSYRDAYQCHWPEWLTYSQNGPDPQDCIPPSPPAFSPIAAVVRAAFLFHGQQIINYTVWKDRPCTCSISTPSKSLEEKQRCVLLKGIVERGAWYLARAGDDVEAFWM
jgi:hypothetical protein